jgi:hypothetical protein
LSKIYNLESEPEASATSSEWYRRLEDRIAIGAAFIADPELESPARQQAAKRTRAKSRISLTPAV